MTADDPGWETLVIAGPPIEPGTHRCVWCGGRTRYERHGCDAELYAYKVDRVRNDEARSVPPRPPVSLSAIGYRLGVEIERAERRGR